MRTVTTTTPGPIDLSIDAAIAHLTVIADPTVTTAEITLAPATPGDIAAAAAINATKITVRGGDRVRIKVPGHNSGASTVIAGNIGGDGDPVTIIGGTVIAGNIGGRGGRGSILGPVTVTGGPSSAPVIRIDARVPAGSVIEAGIAAGSVTMRGPLDVAWTDSGPTMDLSGVESPEAR